MSRPAAPPRATATGERRGLVPLILFAALLATAGAAAAATIVVAFGDSITEGFGDDPARAQRGYPPRLNALLQGRNLDATVLNRGHEGETTAEGVTRVDAVLVETDPDVLLLMEGTNDITARVSNETIAFNLSRIAVKAAARGARTVHATVIPRKSTASFDGDNRVTAAFAGAVRELAWESKRDLADCFEVFTTTPRLFEDYYPADDKFHPNAKGYDLMAEIFFNTMLDVDEVPPVPGRVSPSDGGEGVRADATVLVDVYDFGAGINLARTSLAVNGQPAEAILRGDNQKLELSYKPATPFVGAVTVELQSEDLAVPANAARRTVTRFLIAGTTFLLGDIDRDGRVDGDDLVRLARAFGARKGEIRFLVAADLTNDGIVDGNDLAALALNFGKSSF